MRASLRLLEEHEQKVEALRQALIEGEASGDAGALDFSAIKREARHRSRPGRDLGRLIDALEKGTRRLVDRRTPGSARYFLRAGRFHL